jgi:hypothetical protein
MEIQNPKKKVKDLADSVLSALFFQIIALSTDNESSYQVSITGSCFKIPDENVEQAKLIFEIMKKINKVSPFFPKMKMKKVK